MEANKLKHHFSNTITELATFISEAVSEKLLADLSLSEKTSSIDDKLMTEADVCDFLQISNSTLHKLKKQHKDFPVVRILGNVRYKKSDVIDFLKTVK
nr:helix-turn-helix domain-containing protein [uncultured Flavobacterium sp.]